MTGFSVALDLFPFLAATLAAIACGVLGNFLILRRLSLMGDAISHSVLPGLVIAFMLTATRSPLAMFLGAAAAGLATVVLVELIKRLGRVEPGAAMGVVFSLLFAIGVLLIEQVARNTDLDADCVLHGQLETLVWYDAPPAGSPLSAYLAPETVAAVPRQVWSLLAVTGAALAFTIVFFKELRIAAFDAALSTTQGFHAGVMHYALMTLVAAATVASFEAVGSILVIAMLICPAATARLLTDRLRSQILVSLVAALASSALGYAGATLLPAAFGLDSVNAAGSITVASGLLLALAALLSPRHGLLPRTLRRRRLARDLALDAVLTALYRARERGLPGLAPADLARAIPGHHAPSAVQRGINRHLVARDPDRLDLTETGHDAARELIRRHRLWEDYLVTRAGAAPDHVHDTAEALQSIPLGPRKGPATDPHGREIP